MRVPALIAVIALTVVAGSVRAQDAVPTEILFRTVPLVADDKGGTGFFLDGSRETLYLVTARSCRTRATTVGGTILRPNRMPVALLAQPSID